MKKQILTIAVLVLVTISSFSCKNNEKQTEITDAKEIAEKTEAAIAYTVDTNASVIHWTGSKPAGSHTGTLALSSGTISAKEKNIESGDFTIDMNSLTNTDLEGGAKESLEAHLKGTVDEKQKDFFNVREFPTAKFELTGIKDNGENVTVSGNLTIKDITQNIEFPATVSFSENTMVLKSEQFSIDRTQWDINFMSKSVFDNLKDKFINDQIELIVEVHANKA